MNFTLVQHVVYTMATKIDQQSFAGKRNFFLFIFLFAHNLD